MWVLGKQGALGIKQASNGHGDVTAVSTGPPPSMPLGIRVPHPWGGVVLWCAAPHRPRFGALPSLLCSSVTRNFAKNAKNNAVAKTSDRDIRNIFPFFGILVT